MLQGASNPYNSIKILEICSKKKSGPQRGLNKFRAYSLECPPPRKSLVKGERFIRSEGRPELSLVVYSLSYLSCTCMCYQWDCMNIIS